MSARAAVYHGRNDVRIEDFVLPALNDHELIVEIEAAGVDGSDLKMVKGDLPEIESVKPLVLGDEILGKVIAIGTGAKTVRGLDVGDRVIVEGRWPCGQCSSCHGGNYYTCRKGWAGNAYGWTPVSAPPGLWGSYASHVFVPEDSLVHRVPEGLSAEAALVGASVLANGLRWVREAGVSLGDRVVVIGPGPQGLCLTLAAALSGADVIAVGTGEDVSRLDFARDLGAVSTVRASDAGDTAQRISDSFGDAPSLVFDAAGGDSAMALASQAVAPGGRIVRVALGPPEGVLVPGNELLLKEVSIQVLLAHPYSVPSALALAKRLSGTDRDVGRLVTHSFALDEVVDALECAAYETKERPLKVILRPNLT